MIERYDNIPVPSADILSDLEEAVAQNELAEISAHESRVSIIQRISDIQNLTDLPIAAQINDGGVVILKPIRVNLERDRYNVDHRYLIMHPNRFCLLQIGIPDLSHRESFMDKEPVSEYLDAWPEKKKIPKVETGRLRDLLRFKASLFDSHKLSKPCGAIRLKEDQASIVLGKGLKKRTLRMTFDDNRNSHIGQVDYNDGGSIFCYLVPIDDSDEARYLSDFFDPIINKLVEEANKNSGFALALQNYSNHIPDFPLPEKPKRRV